MRLLKSVDNRTPEQFQFTHPGKGATGEGCRCVIDPKQFQFTHPGKGATEDFIQLANSRQVSIHAPWEGCDLGDLTRLNSCIKFQFTHPGKGATESAQATTSTSQFQFTHPGKGATGTKSRDHYAHYPVSIHAPWEGCDNHPDVCFGHLCSFNSRTLGRVRLHWIGLLRCYGSVSIHAPWEGCDCLRSRTDYQGSCFNSRTLGRVRLGDLTRLNSCVKFQFTHPGKGATYRFLFTGCGELLFQFTHPGKGATTATAFTTLVGNVSIHAPWEGCDIEEDSCLTSP